MFLSKQQKGLINFSLITEEKRNPSGEFVAQNYGVTQLPLVLEIRKKILEGAKENELQEGEIEFSTEEKAFLIKRLTREWGVQDGSYVLEIIESLK